MRCRFCNYMVKDDDFAQFNFIHPNKPAPSWYWISHWECLKNAPTDILIDFSKSKIKEVK